MWDAFRVSGLGKRRTAPQHRKAWPPAGGPRPESGTAESLLRSTASRASALVRLRCYLRSAHTRAPPALPAPPPGLDGV
jgi:hypothetical protein